ncbi:TetR/AcrR family transcriptional regulator [Agrococcus sp. SGAir0287]|uniref:TetR/AcrR family transcriptional regulator n=1 Tax=Agrococcus sp. SGAir0287 TaxID=2070347 RepID=UPI0010CD0FDF|nr:TetR family transcriptional regulator [Agrococcus sp. SGAir0287]QCR18139.1 hypothetical protein C1N71_00655 [Agrococcus sp. SGAir0287]
MEDGRALIARMAAEIVHERGLGALTFASVCERSGFTRSGVVYHFPTKQDLVMAAHEHYARVFSERVATHLDVPERDATLDDRVRAFVRQHADDSPGEIELLRLLEQEPVERLWSGVEATWAPLPDLDDPASMRRFVARLAAHGLWVHQRLRQPRFDEEQLQAIIAVIERRLLDGDIEDDGR